MLEFCEATCAERPSASRVQRKVSVMRTDRVTKAEDADFDKTIKISGIVITLIVVAVAAFWYFG